MVYLRDFIFQNNWSIHTTVRQARRTSVLRIIRSPLLGWACKIQALPVRHKPLRVSSRQSC